MPHLRRVHGFSATRARLAAARLLAKERLSPGDCARLGIDPLPVKRNGALSRVAALSEAPSALPTDAELDAVIRAAGFTA
jgi:hypothetical protein